MKTTECEICCTVYESQIGYCPICNMSEFPHYYEA